MKKNLPDKFPIRYAMILEDEEYNESLEDKTRREILFKQYIKWLQNNIIDLDNIITKYVSLKYSQSCNSNNYLYKLNGDYEEIQNIAKIIDIFIDNSGYMVRNGLAYRPTLISYRGACEIPFFMRKNYKQDKPYKYCKISKTANFYKEKYENLTNRKIDISEIWRLRNFQTPTVNITSKSSEIWEKLDYGFNNGTFYSQNRKNFKEIKKFTINTNYSKKKKISIVLCQDWDSLFTEEIFRLYYLMTTCRNCGNFLPFDSSNRIKYCDDKTCKRDRARKRKRKSQQDK